MPTEEYTKSEFLRALLNQQRQTLQNGGNLVNPSVSQLAQIDTGVQKPVEQPKQQNNFDSFMNNVLGFVDEIAAKFGAGFVNGWEGVLDLGATALGAMGWQAAADWAKQDIGTAAAEWSKTAFGLGSWYDRIRNNRWDAQEWSDIGQNFLDLNQSVFFAKNNLGDMRQNLSDKYYGGNDEVLSQMNIGDFRAGEFLGGVAHSLGMMLPSIMTAGAGAAAGASQTAQKGISLATLGLGAAGKGSEEAMNEGASAGRALAYGAASGAAEVASEIVVGPILAKAGLGTGNINGFGSKTVKELMKSAFEEGMEEVSTATIEPLLKSIYQGEGALEEYKDPAKFLLGIGGDFNESVAGQFASGAFTGGLMSGVSVYQKSKTFGKSSAVVDAVGEARESYQKMLNYKEGSKQYEKYQKEVFESLGNAYKAWEESKDSLSSKQLKNLQEYLQNPGDFIESMKANRDSSEVITEYMNEIKEDNLGKFGGREIGRDIFKAVDQDGMSIKYGDVKGDNNASIKGNTITINSKLSNKVGALLGHEFGVHAISNAIGNAEMNRLYNSIVRDGWLETKEGKAVDELYKNDSNYKEEIVANYIQDMIESKGGTQTQLQYLRSLFIKPSFTQKFLRLFNKNIVKFPSNSAIETEFRSIIKRVVDSSKTSVYKSVIKKLSAGKKLSAEEATAYRSLKNVFDLFKSQEAFSKSRDTDTKNETIKKVDSEGKAKRDSNGRKLSEQQVEFFKDSKARDPFGRLVPVYHSSEAFGFTVFNEAFNDKYRGRPQHGFYFSDSKEVAQSYVVGEETVRTVKDLEAKVIKTFNMPVDEVVEEMDYFLSELDGGEENADIDMEEVNKFLDFFTDSEGPAKDTIGKWKLEVENVENEDYDEDIPRYWRMGMFINTVSGEAITPKTFYQMIKEFDDKTHESVKKSKDKKTYSVYLNIKNPLVINAQGNWWYEIRNPLAKTSENKAIANWLQEIIEDDDYWDKRWYATEINGQRCHHFVGLKSFDDIPAKGKYENGGAAFIAALDKISKYQEVQDYLKAEQEIKKARDDGNRNAENEAVQRARDIFRKNKASIRAYFKMLYTYFEAVEWVQNNEYTKYPEESTRKITSDAYKKGYDGIIFQNVIDIGGDMGGADEISDVYVAFNSNQIKNIDNKTPTEDPDIRYSKDRVLGNYTVGDNNVKLRVRRTKDGYEVYYPKEGQTLTEAVVGGEFAENEKGITTRVGGETVQFNTESNVLKYLEDIGAKRVEAEVNIDKDSIMKTVESKSDSEEDVKSARTEARKAAAELAKNDKKNRYFVREKDGKFYVLRKILPLDQTVTFDSEKAPTQKEMRDADATKVKKTITFKKPIYVKDGDRIFKYVVKKVAKGLYNVSYENTDGEMETKQYTRKALTSELRSYTNISNNRNDLIKKVEKPAKTKKAEVKVKKEKALDNYKKAIGVKAPTNLEKVAKNINKAEAKPKKTLAEIATKRIQKTVKNLETTPVETTKKVDVEKVMEKAKKEITKIAYKNLKQTRDIIDSSLKFVKESFGEDYNVVVPINMNDFVSRTFTDINSVKNVDSEANRLVNKLLETTIEQKNAETGGWQEVGTLEDLLDDDAIKDLQIAAKGIIENSDYSKARSIATRNLEIQLEKARAEAQENKTAQGRVRVLTRIRDRLRRNVGKFHEITNDEIIRSGLYTLLDPFEKIHGANNGGFSAKEFRDNLSKTLEWYTEENLSEHYEGLIYNDAVRAALEDVYNTLGVAVETKNGKVRKNLTSEAMQKSIDAIRLINEDIKRMIKNYTDVIAPASIETKKSIARSNYGRRANVIANLVRMYKRGFAPSYALIEEILGGNSEAARILVTDIQNATNKKTVYTGSYHDEINKQLKELGIKKTIDTKKFAFRNAELTVDQLMGLYISTKVQANYDAINEDGVVVYDAKHNKMIDLAGKGEADALRNEVGNVLPDNYKKLADWLLGTMNDSVKSEYIEWFEKKFGKYQMRNEIGTIKQNSYWMLNRSYQKMDNLSKAVSNPNALFSHAIKRNSGGHNAVLITGALSSFDAYIDKLGSELFIKPNYENALAVLNTKGIDGQSVMDVLSKRNDGTKDINLLRDITRDILGATQRQTTLIDKMVSAFSVAKLSLNIGSMAKQFASAFTSNIPISKTAKALIQRWSPEARAEFKKAFEDIGGLKYREANKGILRANADSVGQFAEKIAQKTMLGISKVDMFTVSTGVYSLMVIGQDQYNYKIGSDENLKFVKDHWYEYELSQIGNTALSRKAISRSDSLVRYLFGFLQGANRAALGSQIHKFGLWERNRGLDEKQIRNALKAAKEKLDTARTEYEADPDSETARRAYIEANSEVVGLNNQLRDYQSYKIAGGKAIMPNMAAGIVAQGILVALINALMKRIKGKKDWDELDIAEEGLALAMAIGVDWVPLVNFVSNIVQGYDVEIPATNLLNQFSAIFKSAGNQNWDTMIRQIAWLAGDMTGVPFQTIYDYIYGTLKQFDPEAAYEFRSVFYASSLQSATTSMKTYADKGNTSKTASMIDLIMKKYKTGSTSDAINEELATLYIAGYNAMPKSTLTQYTNEDGETVQLTAKQITQFTQQYGQSNKAVSELLRLNDYRNLTAEEKAKAIKKLYDAYYSMAKTKVVGTKPEGKLAQMLVLTNGNLELAKYVLSLQKIAQISENSKKTRKELVLEYINKLAGYTKAEKALLMYLAGYSVSGNSLTQLTGLLVRNGASRKDVKEIFG